MAAIIDDLYAYQRDLTIQVLALGSENHSVDILFEQWIAQRHQAVARLDDLMAELKVIGQVDFAMLAVANRQLRALMVA